jgi:hypothetical protein
MYAALRGAAAAVACMRVAEELVHGTGNGPGVLRIVHEQAMLAVADLLPDPDRPPFPSYASADSSQGRRARPKVDPGTTWRQRCRCAVSVAATAGGAAGSSRRAGEPQRP